MTIEGFQPLTRIVTCTCQPRGGVDQQLTLVDGILGEVYQQYVVPLLESGSKQPLKLISEVDYPIRGRPE